MSQIDLAPELNQAAELLAQVDEVDLADQPALFTELHQALVAALRRTEPTAVGATGRPEV